MTNALEPMRTFRRAFVLGTRHGRDAQSWKMRHFTDQVLLGQWMNLGHVVFTALFNVVYGQRLRDPFTMFKVFRRECISGLRFECNAFDFDWELAGKLVRCGYSPLEIPVNYRSRSFAEGKKVTLIRVNVGAGMLQVHVFSTQGRSPGSLIDVRFSIVQPGDRVSAHFQTFSAIEVNAA
jgi:hypothetical protein